MSLHSSFLLIDNNSQDLRRFRCGKPLMDSFLAQNAARNSSLGLSMTWVLLNDDTGLRKKYPVVAYYTLAGGAVTRETLPTHQALPPYPVPVIMLARLAVSREYQGRGLGEKTLVTALRQAVFLSDKGLPAFGVVLDVLDEDALSFYQRFDMFHPFSDNPMRLFVPMQVIRYLWQGLVGWEGIVGKFDYFGQVVHAFRSNPASSQRRFFEQSEAISTFEQEMKRFTVLCFSVKVEVAPILPLLAIEGMGALVQFQLRLIMRFFCRSPPLGEIRRSEIAALYSQRR